MRLSDLAAFLFPMRTHLIAQLQQERADFRERLVEKDTEIRRLRAELGRKGLEKNDTMFALPTEGWQPRKVLPIEIPQGPLDWQGELNQLLQEEEKPDGISSE